MPVRYDSDASGPLKGVPYEDRKLVIKSLAANSPNSPREIARIGLLGSESTLQWSRNADGVTIRLPEKPPCDFAYAFKIDWR